MGNNLDIERVTLMIDRPVGRQILCGWQYHEGEADAERLLFDSMAQLARFVASAADLLPKQHDQIKNTGLDWEWVVALALLHQNSNEEDWYMGRDDIEAWSAEMFDSENDEDDDPDTLYSDFSEKLNERAWSKDYEDDSTTIENDIKALNMFLYLSKPRPSAAAIRAAHRLGLTLKPGEGRLIFDHEPEPAADDTG